MFGRTKEPKKENNKRGYLTLGPLPFSETIMTLSSSYRITSQLWDKIVHFASFPQTAGTSSPPPTLTTSLVPYYPPISLSPADGPLRSEPLPGYSPQSIPVLVRYVYHTTHHTARNANTVPSISPEELPVRLAHRVRELDDLPQGLSDMPSIRRVKEWYAQSFEASTLTRPHSSLGR